jgi:hypothetical protein
VQSINDVKLALNNQSCGVSRALKNNKEPTKHTHKQAPPSSTTNLNHQYMHRKRNKKKYSPSLLKFKLFLLSI